MNRARNAVLRRRELLLGAALVAGCKHETPPRIPPSDYLVNEGAYQVSDPVAPPCVVREGTAIVVERHGAVLRLTTTDPETTLHLRGDGIVEVAGNDSADIRAELAPHATAWIEVDLSDSSRCESAPVRIAMDWDGVAANGTQRIPIVTKSGVVACWVDGPVFRVERVRSEGDAGGAEVFRLEPTSPRVKLSVAGGAFADRVEVTTGTVAAAGFYVLVRIGAAGDGCQTEQHSILVAPSDLPPLGGGSRPFRL